MSSTTISTPPAPTGTSTRLTTHLFSVAVVVFLLAGLVIVLGQAVLLALGDATAARGWATDLAPIAFGGASVAGLLSFALSYRRDGGDTADDDD